MLIANEEGKIMAKAIVSLLSTNDENDEQPNSVNVCWHRKKAHGVNGTTNRHIVRESAARLKAI